MMKSETNLDERQELKLLKIEHNGLWLAFWGLLASIILQAIFFTKPENLAGEWLVFMCLAVYLVAACMKSGIWDRKLKPDFKTNAVVSLVPALVTGLLFTGIHFVYNKNLRFAVLIGLTVFFSIAVLCFLSLSAMAFIYKKRVEKEENEAYEE